MVSYLLGNTGMNREILIKIGTLVNFRAYNTLEISKNKFGVQEMYFA